ncbi:DNA internalization-related competence protein ComEC/Rec2 [Clostridium sp. E02]|uniref:DNA internalization-related competence protein ComEC/Rec2 n=1 Tax=Clostridium sp. E02 TaxID=2487134 RepID=UPI001FAA5845|nr:DNA internalization-related competence protein ComEC/Rec2 [Clostridium sp. E02]
MRIQQIRRKRIIKRPLCLIAVGFVLGETAVLLTQTSWMMIPAALAVGMVLYGILRGRNLLWVLLPLVFFCLGGIRANEENKRWEHRDQIVEEYSGSYVEVLGTIASLEEKNGALQLILKKNQIWKRRKGKRVEETDQVTLPKLQVIMDSSGSHLKDNIRLGQTVTVLGEIHEIPPAKNPGEFDSVTYSKSRGICARIFGEEIRVVNFKYNKITETLRRGKEWGNRHLIRDAGEEDGAIFSAALLGEKSGVPKEVKSLYQKNGIAHLLAISGLHLSFAGLLLYRVLRRCGLSYGLCGLCGTVAILLYGILTGGSPSVIRSVIMMSAGFLAAYLGRTYDLLSAASLSLFALSFHSPFLLTQGGVQLSFGAIFAIGTGMPRIHDWLGRQKPLAGALSASFSIQMATLPIILTHYYQTPLYGILLNAIVVPLMGGVLCSGLGILLLGSISSFGGRAASGTGHYILKFYHFLCTNISSLPYASLTLGRPEAGTLAIYGFYLAILFFCFWLGGRGEKRKLDREVTTETERMIRTIKKLIILALIYGMGLFLVLPKPVKGLEVLFLDVGQGDGILLRTKKNVVLVDGGSSSKSSLGEFTLAPCLKYYGIKKVNYAFVSHGDKDHLSGIRYLLEYEKDITIETLVLPDLGREDEALITLAKLAEERDMKVHYLTEGDQVSLGSLKFTCLYPGQTDSAENPNEESEVLKADYGDLHILFTGDIGNKEEKLLLERKQSMDQLKEINLLKTAHHGSKFSSDETFLDAVKPRWAVISYGDKNSYGHPHKEVLDRFRKRKIPVFKTAKQGAIMFSTDGKRVRVRTFVDGDETSRYNK